jgi:ketosteroid isomerase-like protein
VTEAQKVKEVQKTLGDWRAAWENLSLPDYIGFYDQSFRSTEPKVRDLAAWRAWKADTFSNYRVQRVVVTDQEITVSGNTAEVTFFQDFSSDSKTDPNGYRDYGVKTMTLVRQADGRWLITREDWSEAGD